MLKSKKFQLYYLTEGNILYLFISNYNSLILTVYTFFTQLIQCKQNFSKY